MNKRIEDYLHLYLGCKMCYSSHHEPQDETYTLTAKNLNEAIEFDDRPNLRPLSDMTQDEDTDLCAYCLTSDLEHKEKWDSLLMSEAKRTTYLLKNHFDLFGLIESGLALDATKLPKENITHV